MTEKRIVLKNGIGLHVLDSEGEGMPVILFLHFSGGTLSMWDGILPQFTEGYRVIAPDMRGHGKSDKPETGYHVEDMANDMVLLLRELGIDRCHVVGSSMGAEIGLCLAAAHPEKVSSLVCEGALYNEFGQLGVFPGDAQEIDREKEAQRALHPLRKPPEAASREAYLAEAKAPFVELGIWNSHVQAFLESTVAEKDDGTFTSHYRNHVRSEYIQKYWDLAFESYYAAIQCPVLFLPSEEEWSNARIRHSLSVFSSLAPRSEIKLIPSSIHAYVWMQLPEEAGQAVKAFIESKI
ncbi:MAG: hypothetical protein K0Q90_1275 [Paenibacillaceae bacterium]|jgi:2-succinyl-6-hydroxy-2,4-cyclohexadiene-1-carboxylate synthase|nr:hypothetical protein [Paenibacillaceae bacterium]